MLTSLAASQIFVQAPALRALAGTVVATVGDQVRANVVAYAPAAKALHAVLQSWRKRLNATMTRLEPLLSDASVSADEKRRLLDLQMRQEAVWRYYAAPFYLGSSPMDPQPEAIGVVPVAAALVVGGVALSIGGIAWASSMLSQARVAEGQFGAYESYLDAHAAALAAGKPPPVAPTAPAAPKNPFEQLASAASSAVPALIGLAALAAAGAVVLPRLLKR